MASHGPRRRRYPLAPGELRSSRAHEDEVARAARWLYLRALEKYAPETHEKESRPPTRPHPEIAGLTISTGEIPPIGLTKPQDDDLEARRRYLRRWLAYLDLEAEKYGHALMMEYEEPPDYYPDEQRPKAYLREVTAYMRRQEQRYLEAGFFFEKGLGTWDGRMFEAYVLYRDATPRLSESEIAKKFGVSRQRVSQWIRQAARALRREGEVLPRLPSKPGPRKMRRPR